MRNGLSRSLLVLCLGFLVACGEGGTFNSTPPPPGGGAITLNLIVRDTPPAGIGVLSFEVTIPDVTLQPDDFIALSASAPVELKHLEAGSFLLSSMNFAPGTYTRMDVMFVNPKLTVVNNTGQSFQFAGVNCAIGAVCEFKPATSGTSSFTFSPSLQISSNTALLIDVSLDSILQDPLDVSFTATPVYTAMSIPADAQTGFFETFEDVTGVVANTRQDSSGINRFDLVTSARTLAGIEVGGAVQFDDFVCAPVNFTNCVQDGQVVEVDFGLEPDGNLVASRLQQVNLNPNEQEVEGTVVSLNAAQNQFSMVVVSETPDTFAVDTGNVAQVTLLPGTSFEVDLDGFMIPAGVSFTNFADLVVGQNVQVRRVTGSSGTMLTTDRVRLHRSTVTATVQTGTNVSFNLSNISPLFLLSGINAIEVRTDASQTNFDPSGYTATSGDLVSIRGLLFNRPGSPPILLASTVRQR